MKRWRNLALALAVVASSLSACASRIVTVTVTSPPETVVVTATPHSTATPSPSPAPARPKVLNVCLVGEPDTLYLYGGSHLPATRHVMEAVYDGPIDHSNHDYQPVILEALPSVRNGDAMRRAVFVRRGDQVVDAQGKVVELVEGVRLRPTGCFTAGCELTFERGFVRMDRMEATFSLREDVTWSDGEPLTAQDSVFGYEVASDPATPGYRYLTERTDSYRAVDRWHTKWVGIPGFVDPSYALAFFPPLPRHQLQDQSARELLRADETRRSPLGWGPFFVEEWVVGDHITLLPNREYFRGDEGLPHLDVVVFKVQRDAWDVVAGLLSGSCDVGAYDASFGSVMPLLTRMEEKGLLRVASAPGGEMALMTFGVQSSDDHDAPAFFADPRVRQAVALCVDRKAIVEEVTYGRSVVPGSYLPPDHPLFPMDEVRKWGFDVAAGRALLDEIGWRDADEDGIREAEGVEGISDGQPFAVTLLASADSEASVETGRILRAQLVDCGIRVTIDSRPRWELFADGPEGPLFGRRFDLAEAVWTLGDWPQCERYSSWEIPEGGVWNGANVAGYSNPRYDAACLAARQVPPGSAAYDRHVKETQVIFSEELPALPLFMPVRVALTRPHVENFEMDASAESELWRLETLDVADDGGSP